MSWRHDLAILIQSDLQLSREDLIDILSGKKGEGPERWFQALSPMQQDIARSGMNSQAFARSRLSIEQKQLSLCFFGEPAYPRRLLTWPQAPQVLWYVGSPAWNQAPGLAVVGSRHPSAESRQWLDWQLRFFLQTREAILVSGGARGIDQAAHWLAVREKRPTIALMPVGLHRRYPPDFQRLEEQILAGGGAVVSPFHPDWPLFKANFARRNQVIAALSEVCLIVEARRRSGTLLTARAAQELERALAVVPCSPLSAQGLGGLDLLCDDPGTQMVRDYQDLLALWDLRAASALHGPGRETGENDIHAPNGHGGG